MILMNDFKAEPPELRQAMLDAVSGVFESGWYVLGPEVERFEKGRADACGTSQCVGVGNGMDAIEIALRALEIGAGDEVITTPMTAFATVLAIIRAGATPVLADIEEGTGLLSVDSAERCLSSRTKAVVLVHLYGQVRAMDRWSTFCECHGLSLVEDCAQSHLATWKATVAGSFGAASAYSFYPTKNLGAAGDAGAIVTNDESIASRARRLRNYGQSVRYYHPELGLNSRLDEIHAAMLLKRLEWLTTFTQRRQAIAERYCQQIDNPAIRLLLEPEEMSAHVYHLYVLCCENRDALQDHLKRHQIQTLIHYPVPVHLQEATKGLQRDPTGLKVSESHAQTCLSIPCHPQLSDAAVDRVIDAVNSFKRV